MTREARLTQKRLEGEIRELRRVLRHIRDFPRKGYPRRTKDGYPEEVSYDEFAYKRIVNSYRDAARQALKGNKRGKNEPRKK